MDASDLEADDAMRHLPNQPHYLSVEQLQVVAEQFEIFFAGVYWKCQVYDDEHEGPAIYFTADVANTYDTSKFIQLRILSYLSPNDRLSVEHFKRYVLWRLKRVAVHEVGEGLRFAGQLIWDPHVPLEPSGNEGVA